MEKKVLIPTILGVILLAGIIFTVVYKKSSGHTGKEQLVIETVATKETEPIESKVSTQVKDSTLSDFEVNEGKSLEELSGGKGLIYNTDLEEKLNLQENQSNNMEEVIQNSERFSGEEVDRIVQEQLELQTARPYDSKNDTETLSEAEKESIAAQTEADLSKYEMDMSMLDDPEKVEEILHNMGY